MYNTSKKDAATAYREKLRRQITQAVGNARGQGLGDDRALRNRRFVTVKVVTGYPERVRRKLQHKTDTKSRLTFITRQNQSD